MLLEKLFEKAKKYGITKYEIGVKVYGFNGRNYIYCLKNPTAETLEKIEKAIEELKG